MLLDTDAIGGFGSAAVGVAPGQASSQASQLPQLTELPGRTRSAVGAGLPAMAATRLNFYHQNQPHSV
jgi:hypothetical protein